MQQQRQEENVSIHNAANFSYNCLNGVSNLVFPFLRIGGGRDAYRGVLWSVGLMAVYGAVMEVPEMVGFFYVWFIAVVVQRLISVRSRETVHSHDQGRRWLADRFTDNPAKAEIVIEPLLCMVIGWLLSWVSPGVGAFFGLCGGGICVKTLVERSVWKARVRAMGDAKLEAEHLRSMYEQRQ